MKSSILKSISVFAVGGFVAFTFQWMQKYFSVNSQIRMGGFVYEMPKVNKGYTGIFDLSGREIDRNILTDAEKKTLLKNQEEQNKSLAAAAKSFANGKKEDQKKNESTSSKDKSKDVKKDLSVAVTDSSKKSGFEHESISKMDSLEESQIQMNSSLNKPVVSEKTKIKEIIKSAAEWRALLNTQPTAAHVQGFVTAFSQGQIKDVDFYTISLELVHDQNIEKHNAGLELFKSKKSFVAFNYLAIEYAKANDQSKAELGAILLNYSNVADYAVLNSALSSKISAVQIMGLQVLSTIVQNNQNQILSINQNGSGTGNSLQNGGGGSLTAVLANIKKLQIFVSSLNLISMAADPNAASLASNILGSLQSLVATN